MDRNNITLKKYWDANSSEERTEIINGAFKLIESLENRQFEKCYYCNGDGLTSEHNPEDPHDDGCCSSCPIQMQCDKCAAKGFVIKGSQVIEKTGNEEDDLPF